MNRSIASPLTLHGMLLLALVALTGPAALAAESPATNCNRSKCSLVAKACNWC